MEEKNNIFSRTEMLIEEEGLLKLQNANVLVFGIGGVGSYAIESLVRAGISNITIVDNDVVSISNINRQIIALHSTIGREKTAVMKERILDINPSCSVDALNIFYCADTQSEINFTKFDFIIDAIDSVTSKLLIIENAKTSNTKCVSCMGTGNKIKANFIVCDIKETSVCPLAKVMRKELKARNIDECRVIYSKDLPLKPKQNESSNIRRSIPGSISYTPPMAGLLAAREAILSILAL